MVKYKDLFEHRNLKNLHVVLTSMIAEFSTLGILNQGTTNIIGSGVGKKIAKCLKETVKEFPKDDKKLIEFLINFCDMCDEYIIEDDKIGIKIDKCKYCPKQIGEAEIPGSACPIPSILASCMEELTNKPYKIKLWDKNRVIIKENGYCWFRIK
ncbi:MAG: hypothetical protein GXN95_04410 [Methanococci archaeon]|nr:hypothetical protein [Methanococci archaeon]